MNNNLIKNKKRVKDLGEVFTPEETVEEMLNSIPEAKWKKNLTFLEPSIGNGNMIIPVLKRKIITYKHDIIESLKTIYGIDIMEDNVNECHKRILQTCIDNGLKEKDLAEANSIIKRNIIVGNALELDIDNLWND